MAIFPDIDQEGLLIVPTCQRAAVDLVNTGVDVEDEKDVCLEKFMTWANAVCDHLKAKGLWCDFIDPCSGLPVRSEAVMH
jgi:hypothetical protein